MANVNGHPRRVRGRTVFVERQNRMPPKRDSLHPEDQEVYELEREVVRLQRKRDEAANASARYESLGFWDMAQRKQEEALTYDRRRLEFEARIRRLRREAMLEGVWE